MVNQTPYPDAIPQNVWDSLPPSSKKKINQLHGLELHIKSFLPNLKAIYLLHDLAAIGRAGFSQTRLIEEGEAMDSQGMIPFLSFYQRCSDFFIGLAE